MQEIAQQFKEEYTELLSRYKEQLTNARIMSILQSITRKQIGIKDNPGRFKGLGYAKGFPIVDELNHMQSAKVYKEHLKQILASGPSFMEKYALKNRPKMTLRTKIIIAKCVAFPVYFITMPVTFIVGGVRGIIKTWKMFIELDSEEIANA